MLKLKNDTVIATPYRINPDLDRPALRRAYEEDGRVRVYGLLEDGAMQLYEHFLARTDWIHLINVEGGILELDPVAKAALSAEEWAAIEAAAHARVKDHFQYRYEAVRVNAAEQEKIEDPLADFARFMQSADLLEFLRDVTGHDELAFTDGQATAYGTGDFLTGHDDDVAGKGRLAAYVYGLTPYWRLEYGGLLLFHGPHDRTVAGNVPRFNTLDLFRVPQQHSVSIVTPAAPHRRFAVTGWLRSAAG
ncbi:MAG TPA: 2OG-Fe(II) oxygenase family protein [Allosphingosinicella sp.]|nr:2OG-Fe(II) oxygenase family protein [Allosphingosinicella sp.]